MTTKEYNACHLKYSESEDENVHEHGHPHTHVHSHEHTVNIRNRLAKAIGHLEAVKRMVENERDCTEILIQLAAVKSAINNTGKYMLKEHLSHCIVEAVESGNYEEIKELNKAIEYFIK